MKLTITKTGKLSKCTLAKGESTVILSHDVKVISAKAFDSCREKITKLVIGEGVTAMEAGACSGMTALTELVLPSTLTEISARAFEGCSAISEIYLPDSVKEIGTYAFYGCENLERLRLPIGLEKLSECIGRCPKLINIEIPDSVEYIAPRAFSLVNMEQITLGQGVKTIDGKAFYGNKELKKVTLPSCVSLMAKEAFAECSALEEFVFPADLRVADFQKKDVLRYFENCTALKTVKMTRDQAKTYLKATAAQLKKESMPYKADKDKFEIFKDCEALSEIVFLADDASRWSDGTCDFKTEADGEHLLKCLKPGILEYTVPEDVTVIEDKAFAENTRLKRIDLNDRLTHLDLRQFLGCRLESLTIPDSLTEIADNNFLPLRSSNQYGKSEWANIQISPSHPTYGVQDEMLYLKKDGAPHTLLYNLQPVRWDALSIPEGIEILAPFCCEESKQTEVELPDSLRVIGERAFANNRNLSKINLPEGLEEIGAEAFLGCRSLMELQIPDSVVRFGKGVVVPKKAVILCSKDSAADKYAQANGLDVRYVGADSEAEAQEESTALFDWGEGRQQQIVWTFLGGTDDVTLPTEIGGVAVKGYEVRLLDRVRKTVKRVVVPEGIEEIPYRFFNNCGFLEEVVLPSTLVKIGELAFGSCWNLEELEIPEGVTDIAENAFGDTLGQKYIIIRGVWGSAAHKRAQADGCRFVDIHADEETQHQQRKFIMSVNEDDTLTLTGAFWGDEKDGIIPERIGGREVSAIAHGFQMCDEMTFPKTLRQLGRADLKNVEKLTIDSENTHFKTDGKLWYSCGGRIVEGALYPARFEKELWISEEAEKIREDAFDYCTALKKLHIPANVLGVCGSFHGVDDMPILSWRYAMRLTNTAIVGRCGSFAERLAEAKELPFLSEDESEQTHALREKFMLYQITAEMAEKNPSIYPQDAVGTLAVGGCYADEDTVYIPEQIEGQKVCCIAQWNDEKLPKEVHIPVGIVAIKPTKLAEDSIYVSEENPVFCSEDGKLYNKVKKQLVSCPKNADITVFWAETERIAPGALDEVQTEILRLPEGVKYWEDDRPSYGKKGNKFGRVILPETLIDSRRICAKEVVMHDHQMLLMIYCGECDKVKVLDEHQQIRYILPGSVFKAFDMAAIGERYHVYMHQTLTEETGSKITSDEEITPAVMMDWYDRQIEKIKSPDEKICAAMYRLRAPYGMAEWTKDKITGYLRRVVKKALQFAVDSGEIELLMALLENGIITRKNSQTAVEMLSEKNMVEWTAMLLEWTRRL